MEVMLLIIILVIIVFVILVVGGIDNERPVSKWSDDKLIRMHGKLVNAASTHLDSKNYSTYKKYSDKANEVKIEIDKRQSNNILNLANPLLQESTNLLEEYIENIVARSNLSNTEAQQFAIDCLHQYENEDLSQGMPEQYASASAYSRLISEKPLPNENTQYEATIVGNKDGGINIQKDIEYEIKSGVGLKECSLGMLGSDFEKIFGGVRREIVLTDDTLNYIVSRENGVDAKIEKEKIEVLFFYFSTDKYSVFPGETDKGIGRESTINDVLKAYLEPDEIEEDELTCSTSQNSIYEKELEYEQLGITFYFKNEKLSILNSSHKCMTS